MKSKLLSYKGLLIAISTALAAMLSLGATHAVYAIDFAATFTPQDGTAVQDAGGDITITFDRAVYADNSTTPFTGETLEDIITLRKTDHFGDAIAYGASINAANTTITIDPNSDLTVGAIYVAISNAYYDTDGDQGDPASITFTISAPPETAPETAPAATPEETPEATPEEVAPPETAPETAPASAPEETPEETPEATPEEVESAPETAPAAAPEETPPAAAPPTVTPDTTAPTVTIEPADGTTTADATQALTLTFSEAIFKDATETAFANADLASVLTVQAVGTPNTDITYSATINADNTIITIDPDSDLPIGQIYVAISNAYYDAAGNQGSQAGATFTITPPPDTTAPTVTIEPADGTTTADATQALTLTFSEAIFKDATETAFANADLASVLTVQAVGTPNTDITYSATINADNTIITIDPDSDLPIGQIYVAISNAYYDAAGNQGSQAGATFTISAPPQPTPEPTPTPTTIVNDDVSDTPVDPPADTPTDASDTGSDTKIPVDVSSPRVLSSLPEDKTIVTDNTTTITVTFNKPIYKDMKETSFTSSDLAGIITLRTDDRYGYGIAHQATISTDNTVVTITPNDVLGDGDVYVAVSGDYYDSDGVHGGETFEAIFTVDTGAEIVDLINTNLLTGFFGMFPTAPITQPLSQPTLATEPSEALRRQKIEEALTLLWNGL